MKNLPRIFLESFRQAWQSLLANKLRSFLSLLGITIGIFCIIGVLSAVDSLKDNIIASFDAFGQDVIYVNRFSWTEDPMGNYWKWAKNPQPSYKDFKAIQTKIKSIDLVGYYVNIGRKLIQYKSSSVEGGQITGLTTDSNELYSFKYEKGRYFSDQEMKTGAAKVVLGHTIAEELFGPISPIGKKIKVGNRKLEVIGVLKKQGESIVSFINWDEVIVISFALANRYVNVKEGHKFGAMINVKGKKAVAAEDITDELRSVLRARRRLKPKEKDDFAINEVSILQKGVDQVFLTLNIAGSFIGIFALLVGMFSVANIMFVSVKERTGLIGVKKALGAKKYVILLEFLIESIVLCLIGGLLGLLLVGGSLYGVSKAINFPVYLDGENIMIGLGVSIFTGILAGFIPAYQAAKMNPVAAIRN